MPEGQGSGQLELTSTLGELERILEKLSSVRERLQEERSLRSSPPLEEQAKLLLLLFERFGERHEFAPGMLVQWKPGLKNKRRPQYGQPGIVVEVLDEPVLDANLGGGSAYFREPLDLAAALLDEEGDLDVYWFDSRRFEPFE